MYIVYFQMGNCCDGDHDCGLLEFDNMQEAMAKKRQILQVQSDAVVVVFYGQVLEEIKV